MLSKMSAPLASCYIPVHCVVEQIPSQGQSADFLSRTDLDYNAIVPDNVLFSDLVRTAFRPKLGYTPACAPAAEGAIQLKNWKPLTFDQITESPAATVGDILGQLSTVATLRIRLHSRPKPLSANDVKEKLLQVLLAQSKNFLISSGCPLDPNVLADLAGGHLECDIPDETSKKFGEWYLQQNCRQVAVLKQSHPAASLLQQHPASSIPPQKLTRPQTAKPISTRSRIRTNFDPDLELPRLRRWFADNQHPSRLQIQQYVGELNSLESRRGFKPLDTRNLVYWFMNARAALKRAKQKRGAGPQQNGEQCRMMDTDPRTTESRSESQEASDDSNHTLAVRRQLSLEAAPVVKDKPKDSVNSSESGEEDMSTEQQYTAPSIPPQELTDGLQTAQPGAASGPASDPSWLDSGC